MNHEDSKTLRNPQFNNNSKSALAFFFFGLRGINTVTYFSRNTLFLAGTDPNGIVFVLSNPCRPVHVQRAGSGSLLVLVQCSSRAGPGRLVLAGYIRPSPTRISPRLIIEGPGTSRETEYRV